MDASSGIKAATEIAQNQFVFGILFIVLLGVVLWFTKMRFDQMDEENQLKEDKNDAVIEKIERMHEQRNTRLEEIIEENKQESKDREAQLMTHNNTLLVQLQSQTSSLEEITRTQASMQATQEKMQENLSKIEQRIEKIEEREVEREKENKERN